MELRMTSLYVLMTVFVPLAIGGCQNDCLCGHEVDLLKCNCSSSNFTCVVSYLGDSVTSLNFTTVEDENVHIDLQAAGLSRFRNLTYLSIATPTPEQEVFFTDLYGLNRAETLQDLGNLKTLRINLLIHYSTDILHNMLLAPLVSLEELDLSYIGVLSFTQLRENFAGMTTRVLKILRLRSVQAHANNQNLAPEMNLTWFLEPLEQMPLEILDFSKNALFRVTPGILRHTSLKEVYFQENSIRTNSFYTELLFHPTLEVVVGDCQGCEASIGYKRKSYSDWMDELDRMTEKSMSTRVDVSSVTHDVDKSRNRSVEHREQTAPKEKSQFQVSPSNAGSLICRYLSSGILGSYPFFENIDCNYFPDYDPEIVGNSCIYGIRLPIGPNLKEVSWAHLSFYQGGYGHPINGNYCFSLKNNLRLANFANLGKWEILLSDSVNGMIFKGLTEMEVFTFEDSELKLRNTKLFSGLPNLRVLNLRGNTVVLENDTNADFFAKNNQLQVLILAKCDLSIIHSGAFSHLEKLLVLDLSDNELTNASFSLPITGHLQTLLLQKNNIQTLPPEIRKQLNIIAAYSTVEVDLSDNPLSCACGDIDFVKWIQTTKVVVIDGEDYRCFGAPTGINLIMNIDPKELDSLCHPSYVAVICASVLSTLVVVGIILACFILYRKRYVLMHLKYKRFTRPRLTLNVDEVSSFRYDAFIVYNSDDKWWTHHALLAEIEDKRNLKLCIYLRDFPAGGNYADVIEEAMKQSRKTVLILSPKFFKSNWCMHEMSMVHNKLVAEGVDLMELVILSPLASNVMTCTLAQLLQNKTPMTWTNDPDGQKLFWDKLEDAIRRSRSLPNLY